MWMENNNKYIKLYINYASSKRKNIKYLMSTTLWEYQVYKHQCELPIWKKSDVLIMWCKGVAL